MNNSIFKLRLIFTLIILIGITRAQNIPEPDIANGVYGKYELNSFDFWKASSNEPTPLVIYIHGGGFTSGSKEKVSHKMVSELLSHGISVMSINYRLSPEAIFPEHYMDCARAIQYMRFHAAEFNLNPHKIAVTGSSAGGCTALWIGFHDDMADTSNPDVVLRETTRLTCMAVTEAQSTLQPEVIRELVGDIAFKHSFYKGGFFGLTPEEIKTDKAEQLIKQASPITYLTEDDPPVWAYYGRPKGEPDNVSDAIHHINFGLYLKEKMDNLGMECTIRDPENCKSKTDEMIKFLVDKLK